MESITLEVVFAKPFKTAAQRRRAKLELQSRVGDLLRYEQPSSDGAWWFGQNRVLDVKPQE
jgi:hypothetical protein